jgi:hypothetical protein
MEAELWPEPVRSLRKARSLRLESRRAWTRRRYNFVLQNGLPLTSVQPIDSQPAEVYIRKHEFSWLQVLG